MSPKRRYRDALKSVDSLVQTHLQQGPVDARRLANLAIGILAENTHAARTTLLLREGGSLVVALALGESLEPATMTTHDQGLVREAELAQKLVQTRDALAVPLLLGGAVEGVVYLARGARSLNAETVSLAEGVATRIATLLHSARLVEDAARRAANVATIEAMGARLAARELRDEDLRALLEAALRATASDEAILCLLAGEGSLLDVHVAAAGAEPATELRSLGAALAARLIEAGSEAAEAVLGEAALLEPLGGEPPAGAAGGGAAGAPAEPTPPLRPLGLVAVRRVAAGDADVAPAYGDHDRSVFRALSHLLAGALARLAYYRQASLDTLTGTGSRLALELAIVEAVETARAASEPLSVLLVDVDRFKQINDTHGHLAGDAILKSVAGTLRARLRARDFVARFGGDEFLVLLPGTHASEAVQLAEDLRQRVADETASPDGSRVTLSIGVSAFPTHAAEPRALVRRADEALYFSKTAGRDRVTVATA